jgi:putative oxidoreductase
MAAGAAEAGGGALLLVGLATPAAVAALSGSMITAIRTVHLKNGPWVTGGGYEYNAVLLATLFSVAESGPGMLSLDALRGRSRWGTKWAIAALGAGAAGSYLATRYAERQTQLAGIDQELAPESGDAQAPSAADAAGATAGTP